MNNAEYWDHRYKKGIGPGSGSKGRLAAFKLKVVQDIVDTYKVKSIADVGCGDGSQLMALKVDEYKGFDVSNWAIARAIVAAGLRSKWEYFEMDEEAVTEPNQADMAVSLDVIPFLDEKHFKRHLDMLFHLSRRYVLIYAPNRDAKGLRLASHMHFRQFVPVVKELFKLAPVFHVPNEHPAEQIRGRIKPDTSFAEFYLFDMESKKRKRRTKNERTTQ